MIEYDTNALIAIARQLTLQGKTTAIDIVEAIQQDYPSILYGDIIAALYDPQGANQDVPAITQALDYMEISPTNIVAVLFHSPNLNLSKVDVAKAIMDNLNMPPNKAELALEEGLDLCTAEAHDLLQQAKSGLTDDDIKKYYSPWEPLLSKNKKI